MTLNLSMETHFCLNILQLYSIKGCHNYQTFITNIQINALFPNYCNYQLIIPKKIILFGIFYSYILVDKVFSGPFKLI